MVWIQSRVDILLVLILVQTVCKGYQQTEKVATNKERVKLKWKINDKQKENSLI